MNMHEELRIEPVPLASFLSALFAEEIRISIHTVQRRGLPGPRKELLHFLDLELDLVMWKDFAVLTAWLVDLAQVGRELEAIDASAVVADDDNWLVVVETDVSELGALDHLLLAQRLVLVFCEIKHVDLAGRERREEKW